LHIDCNDIWDVFLKGPLDALFKIVKSEGPKALFDGVGARIIWLTPRLSIAVSSYGYFKENLSERFGL
jgi:hypothetical protein